MQPHFFVLRRTTTVIAQTQTRIDHKLGQFSSSFFVAFVIATDRQQRIVQLQRQVLGVVQEIHQFFRVL